MTLSMPLGMTIGLRRTFPMMWGELIGVGLVSIAILSFVDARPRGMSDIDFEDEDEFSVKDFLSVYTTSMDKSDFMPTTSVDAV